MSEISYYKTTQSETLAAWNEYCAQHEAMVKSSKAIRDHFGAEAFLTSNSFTRKEFHGLAFAKPMDVELWTKPDQDNVQRPRAVSSVPKHRRAEHASLVEEYKRLKPTQICEFEPIFKAIGCTWSDFVFGGSYAVVVHDGIFYLRTNRKVADHMVEILASEFTAAEHAENQAPE